MLAESLLLGLGLGVEGEGAHGRDLLDEAIQAGKKGEHLLAGGQNRVRPSRVRKMMSRGFRRRRKRQQGDELFRRSTQVISRMT
ncbi:MAG: hypothetical protein H6816_14175 [Phycisphaerales bacterium]|nr:hypothetical protein [Phycisphaerales bacterium]